MKNPGRDTPLSPAYRLGLRGEALAATHLENKGYRILERRKRIGGIEIDLIASFSGLLIFVEVKTRTNDLMASPESAVDEKKRRRMIAAADIYARERNLNAEIRFDIVSVVANPCTEDILHLEGAFPPFF